MFHFDWWAPVARSIVAPLWAWWEGSSHLRHYRTLLQTQFDNPETVRARQWQALTAQLRHAYDTTPFWRTRLDALDLRPEDVRSFADFQAVPVLTKHDLRTRGPDLLSAPYRGMALHRKATSGSTGIAVEVFVDEPAQQWKRAFTIRSDEWSGWRRGERMARIWGNPAELQRGWRRWLRNTLLERCRFLDSLQINAETLADFAASLRGCPPSLLFGHAHSLYLLAEYVERHGGAGFQPRGVISAAMVLHDWQRRSIERAFGCPVTNRYGCEEVSLIACECERHEGLHVNADGIYLEVIRPDGSPAEPGEAGSLLVTDLVNRAMPLLRYQVGDAGALSERRCACGRGLPLLDRLEGREADYVVTPQGHLVSGISLTDHFATLVPGVAQLQIIQETVSHFRFRIVRDGDFGPASLQRLRELVSERFGAAVDHECEYVERIPQEPSGKYRFCISRVPNPFTRVPEDVCR
jgi:phenylacetate-CoA ligase